MFESGRPRHEQISEWLRKRIVSGAFGPDERLPSESQIGKRFGVSRITVRRALHTLDGEGLIYRRQGLGSFVQGRRLKQGLARLTDFDEDMRDAGLSPASIVIGHQFVTPPADVAEALRLSGGGKIWQLDRLRLADGNTIAFDRTWLPVFYAQMLQDFDLARQTIYSVLEHHCRVPIVSGRYRIQAVCADAEIAGHLRVPVESGALLVERLTVTDHDRRVYLQRRYYRGDRVLYEVNLTRDVRFQSFPNAMLIQDFEPVFS